MKNKVLYWLLVLVLGATAVCPLAAQDLRAKDRDTQQPWVLAVQLGGFTIALERANTLAEVSAVVKQYQSLAENPQVESGLAALAQNPGTDQATRLRAVLMMRLLQDTRTLGVDAASTLFGTRVMLVGLVAMPDSDARVKLLREHPDVVKAASDQVLRAAVSPPGGTPEPDAKSLAIVQRLFRESRAGDIPQAVQRFEQASAALAAGGTSGARETPEAAGNGNGGGAREGMALVGHWRHTALLGSGDAAMTTDHHCQMLPDGTYRYWTHTVSSFSDSTSSPETGRWELRGNVLTLYPPGAQPLQSRIECDGSNLVMKDWQSRRFWERAR